MQHYEAQKAELLKSQDVQNLARTAGDFVRRLSEEQSWFADQGSVSQQAPAKAPFQHKRAVTDNDLCEQIAEVKVSQASGDRGQHRPKRHKTDIPQASAVGQQAPQRPHAASQDNALLQEPFVGQRSSARLHPAAATIKQEASMSGAQQSSLRHAKQGPSAQQHMPERHSSEDSDVSTLARSNDDAKLEDSDTSSDQPAARMPMHHAGRPRSAAHQPAAAASPTPGSAVKPIVIDSSDDDDVPLSVRKANIEASTATPAAAATAARTTGSGHAPAAAGERQQPPAVHGGGKGGASSPMPYGSPLWQAAQVPLPGDEQPPGAAAAASRPAPATARKSFMPRMPSRLGSVLDGVPVKRQHDTAASQCAAGGPPAQQPAQNAGDAPPATDAAGEGTAREHAAAQPATGSRAAAAVAAAAAGRAQPSHAADPVTAPHGPSLPQKRASQAQASGQARTKASLRSMRTGPADAGTGGRHASDGQATADDQPRAGQKRPAASPLTPRMFKAARHEEASPSEEGSPMDIDDPRHTPGALSGGAQPVPGMRGGSAGKPQAGPSRFNPMASRAAHTLRTAAAQGPAKSGGSPLQRTHLPSAFAPRREQQQAVQKQRQEAGARLNISTADWLAARSCIHESVLKRPTAAAPASPKTSGRAKAKTSQQPAAPAQHAPAQQEPLQQAAATASRPQPPTSPPRAAFGFRFKPRSPPHSRSAPADAEQAGRPAPVPATAAGGGLGKASKHRTASQAGLAAGLHAEARAPKRQRQHSPLPASRQQQEEQQHVEEEVEVVAEMPGRGSRAKPVDLSCASPRHLSARSSGSQPAHAARAEQAAPAPAAQNRVSLSSVEVPVGKVAAPEVAVRADRDDAAWADAQKAEWEARQAEIQRQQKDSQEQKRRRKLAAEQEQRSKARVEELRRSMALAAQQSSERDQLRTRIRAELQARMGYVYSPAHLLQKLSIPLRGGPTFSPTPAQLRATFKAAMLQWHPDRHSSSPPEQQARAEEMFKILNQWSSKVPSA